MKSDFSYRLTRTESEIYKCSNINDNMMIKGCDINSEYLKESANDLFLMFNGTYKGISVNNTFKRKCPGDNGRWTAFCIHTSHDSMQ